MIYHLPFVHSSLFFKFRVLEPTVLNWVVEFSEDSKYDVDTDQSDWNKLTGIKWNYFKPRENSIMVGWRYDNTTDLFDLCLYFHKDNSFDPCMKTLVSVKDKANISLVFNEIEKTATLNINGISETIDWSLFDRGYLINSWFGGNRTPKKLVKFKLTNI